MSLFPVLEYYVRGAVEPGDYDLFDKRTLRASSALPDSVYLRGATSVPKSLIQRSASVAREILEEPEIISSSNSAYHRAREYSDYLSEQEQLDRRLVSSKLLEEKLRDSGVYNYISTRGYTIPLYRRRYPSSYWWNNPYSTTLPYRYNYPEDNFGYSRREAYVPYSYNSVPYRGQSRMPFRDWRTESPYRSYSPNRPRYFTPTVRSSYLYPKYV